MASLADLFNPSFFIILGIVALFIALVVVYFESKMRDQNHKIASMLSLVSTLAEDMHGVKAGLNHLAMTTVKSEQTPDPRNTPFLFVQQNLETENNEEINETLIEVSDDESEYNDNSDSELDEDDEQDDEESNSESDDEDLENIKVIKLNISDKNEDDDITCCKEENNLDFEPDDDLAILDELDEIPEISEEYTEEMLSLKYDEVKVIPHKEDIQESIASELKTISINLGEESQSENIEYKKLQLPKLRSIAVEKGLTNNSDAQKLKKPDLLKLLGAE